MTAVSLAESLVLITTLLGTVAVVTALVVTAFIFFRSRQDISEIKEIEADIRRMHAKSEEAVYISDEMANVLYDLYELIGLLKAYSELRETGYKVNEALFEDMNCRISFAEKHFAELGLFSIDAERRKSVQLALVNKYGDHDTLRIMQKIVDGKIGIRDDDIQISLRLLERRLRENFVPIQSSAWTGRPSGGSF
jgi:hypothetical protein